MRMTAWEKSRHPQPFPVANITLGLTFLGKSHVTKIWSWFGIVHSVRSCQFVIIKSFSMLILLVRCCLNMDVSAVHDIERKPQFDGILPSGPYPPCLRMADRALLAIPSHYRWWRTEIKSLQSRFYTGFVLQTLLMSLRDCNWLTALLYRRCLFFFLCVNTSKVPSIYI